MKPSALSGSAPLTRGLPRVARGAVVGVVASALATGGHALAGGQAPSPTFLITFLTVCALAAAWLSDLRWDTRRLAGALLLAQGGFHATLMMSMPMGHDDNPLVMAGWHVIATVVTLIVLVRAEDAIWALLERVVLRASDLLVNPPAPATATRQPLATTGVVAMQSALAHLTTAVRGPPVNAA